MDEWYRFDKAFAAYREVLREGGHDGRGQDTLGILLACADLALGPELAEDLGIPMVDDLSPWAQRLRVKSMLEYEDNSENWRSCLRHLLTSRVDAWRSGSRSTVGALLDEVLECHKTRNWDRLSYDTANELLAQAGLKVLRPGYLLDFDGKAIENDFVLAIPNESQLVAQQFRETQWAGVPGASVWKSALRQGPVDVVVTDDKKNRVRINGYQSRCTLVRLRGLEMEGETNG